MLQDKSNLPLRVLAIADGWIPSAELVLREPLEYLEREGALTASIHLISEPLLRDKIGEVSLVIMMRVYQPEALEMAKYARALAIPVIYAIDDDLEALSPDTPLGRHYQASGAWPRIEEICRLATQVWVFSDVMKAKLGRIQPRTVKLPAMASIELIDELRTSRESSPPEKIIGYAGSITHDDDFEAVSAALGGVLETRPDFVFEVIGVVPEGLRDHPRVRHFDSLPTLHDYYDFVLSRNWMLGIAPLNRNAVNDAKTDNKYREYAALGIPGVYANVPAYWSSVVDNITGVMVHSDGDWGVRILELIDDAELRVSISAAALSDVRARYGLDRVASRYLDCMLGAVSRPIRVLVAGPKETASVDIDVTRPLNVLEAEGTIVWKVRSQNEVTESDIRGQDVFVIYRYTDPETVALARLARKLGVATLYAYDDDLLFIPDGLGALTEYYRHPSVRRALQDLLREVDYVKTTTPALAKRSRAYAANVVDARAGFDFEQIAFERQRASKPKGVVIGFFGNPARLGDNPAVARALAQIATEFEDVRFELFGSKDNTAVAAWASGANVTLIPWHSSTADAIRELLSRSWDIGLAPLEINEFNRSKTPAKYRVYGACAIAGIYTRIDPYADSVRDGETGLLVDNDTQSWVAALRLLIKDSRLRERLGRGAYLDVRERFCLEVATDHWRELLRIAARTKRTASDAAVLTGAPTDGADERRRAIHDDVLRQQALSMYAEYERTWRWSGARLLDLINPGESERRWRSRLGDARETLLRSFAARGIDSPAQRLRPSRNLQHCAFVEYPFLPHAGHGRIIEVAVWTPVVGVDGEFGLEIVSPADEIVAHRRAPLGDLKPGQLARFDVDPLDIDDPTRWRIRFFANGSPTPVHVFHWSPPVFMKRTPRRLGFFLFRDE